MHRTIYWPAAVSRNPKSRFNEFFGRSGADATLAKVRSRLESQVR
jgi:hypothetical protein